MATIRKLCCNDLLQFASVNLDHLTTTCSMYLYMKWLVKWPNDSHVAIAPGNQMMGYIIGGFKEKDQDKNYWHGLAILLNVASEYRRQKLGTRLMRLLEKQMVGKMLSSKRVDHYYMFLYVADFNTPAQRFFGKIGYQVHATKSTSVFKKDGTAFEMVKEVAEERLPSAILAQFALCSFCKEAKKMISEALSEEREYFHFTTGELLTLRNWPMYNLVRPIVAAVLQLYRRLGAGVFSFYDWRVTHSLFRLYIQGERRRRRRKMSYRSVILYDSI